MSAYTYTDCTLLADRKFLQATKTTPHSFQDFSHLPNYLESIFYYNMKHYGVTAVESSRVHSNMSKVIQVNACALIRKARFLKEKKG